MKNYRNEDPTQNKYNIPYEPPAGASTQQELNIRLPDEWENRRPTVADRLFSPRLVRDLQGIGLPEDFPEPDFWGSQGLYIYGDTGAGKTVLSANLLLDVKKHLWLNFQQKTCSFKSVPALLDQLKQSYSDNSEITEWEVMEELRTTWLLVLDDLGVSGKPSDWLIEKLYLLINFRYENLLPTVITSNLDLNELTDLLDDDRITSRINRMSHITRKRPWDSGHE